MNEIIKIEIIIIVIIKTKRREGFMLYRILMFI